MPIEKKKELADIVIDNSSTIEATHKRTLEVYKELENAFQKSK
jgi:dephospho-CoA kinase